MNDRITEVIREIVREEMNKLHSNKKREGAIWSEEEDKQLMDRIVTTIREIAVAHQRSVGAIESRIYQKYRYPFWKS